MPTPLNQANRIYSASCGRPVLEGIWCSDSTFSPFQTQCYQSLTIFDPLSVWNFIFECMLGKWGIMYCKSRLFFVMTCHYFWFSIFVLILFLTSIWNKLVVMPEDWFSFLAAIFPWHSSSLLRLCWPPKDECSYFCLFSPQFLKSPVSNFIHTASSLSFTMMMSTSLPL